MALQLVKHAFWMIFNNLNEALRASAVPLLILLALNIVGGAFFAVTVDPAMPMTNSGDMLSSLLIGLLLIVVTVFVFGWVAVTWHRFILREEYPGVIPVIADRPIWPYIWKSFLIGLIIALCLIPIMMVLTPIISTMGFGGILVAGFVAGLVLSYIWLRFAIVLPGTAVGAPLGIGKGWGITKPLSGSIFGVAVILGLINTVLTLVTTPIAGIPIIGFLISSAGTWLTIMLGLSILTTLYGHLVEGRDLPN